MLTALLYILDTPPSLLGEKLHASIPAIFKERDLSLGDPQTSGQTLPTVESFTYLINDGPGDLTGKHIFLGSLQQDAEVSL